MTDMPVIERAALERLTRMGGGRLVRQMLEMYLSLGAERLEALRSAAAAGDADRVERAVHTLKSTAGNVGAVRLQYTATEIESRAAAGVIDMELVNRIPLEYEESAQALRTLLEEPVE